MSDPLESRGIPEQHEEWLRRMLNLGDQWSEELPADVRDAYWRASRMANKIGARVTCDTLVVLLCALGYGKPTVVESKPESIISLWQRKAIKYDDCVEGKWRDKILMGKCRGITGDKKQVKVMFDGQTEERTLDPDSVWVPQPAAV